MSKTEGPKYKKASLTKEELEELAFYLRVATEREFELNFWKTEADRIRASILNRLSIDPTKTIVKWDNLIEKGSIEYAPRLLPEKGKDGLNKKKV